MYVYMCTVCLYMCTHIVVYLRRRTVLTILTNKLLYYIFKN